MVAWMKRHLAATRASTPARASSGSPTTRSGARPATTRCRRARRSSPRAPGALVLNPADAVSGTPVSAGPAANAVTVTVPPPGGAAQVAGEPPLALTYSGTGRGRRTCSRRSSTRRAASWSATRCTPIPVTLDGKPHTVDRPLEGIAASLTPPSRLTLQVMGGSQVYGPVRSAADVQIAKARLEYPDGRRAARRRRRRAARLAPLHVAAQLRDPAARAAARAAEAARHARHGRRQAREGVPPAAGAARPGRPPRPARRSACA